jgi:hypothetical protein
MSSNHEFPPWDDAGAFDFRTLKAELTRDSAPDLLRDVLCPRCGATGNYRLFDKLANNAVGIMCTACGAQHPFMGWGIQWVPVDKAKKRRSNDIAAVIK